MKRLIHLVITSLLIICLSGQADAQRVRYPGRHHTTSHGGHYSGGHGSSHKGGHYKNTRTGNHYGRHKK